MELPTTTTVWLRNHLFHSEHLENLPSSLQHKAPTQADNQRMDLDKHDTNECDIETKDLNNDHPTKDQRSYPNQAEENNTQPMELEMASEERTESTHFQYLPETVVTKTHAYYDDTEWFNNRDHGADCFLCQESVGEDEPCVSAACDCKNYRRKPFHATCFLQMFEMGENSRDPFKGQVPKFAKDCDYCKSPLLGPHCDTFHTACLQFRKYLRLSKFEKTQRWMGILPNVVKELECVVHSIWTGWRCRGVHNPILSAAFGTLSGAHSQWNYQLVSTTSNQERLVRGHQTFAVISMMKALEQIGNSTIWGLSCIKWLIELMKEGGAGMVENLCPVIGQYLVMILSNCFTMDQLQMSLAAQKHYMDLVNCCCDVPQLGHILQYLNDLLVYFLINTNTFGSYNYNTTKVEFNVVDQMLLHVLRNGLGGERLLNKFGVQADAQKGKEWQIDHPFWSTTSFIKLKRRHLPNNIFEDIWVVPNRVQLFLNNVLDEKSIEEAAQEKARLKRQMNFYLNEVHK